MHTRTGDYVQMGLREGVIAEQLQSNRVRVLCFDGRDVSVSASACHCLPASSNCSGAPTPPLGTEDLHVRREKRVGMAVSGGPGSHHQLALEAVDAALTSPETVFPPGSPAVIRTSMCSAGSFPPVDAALLASASEQACIQPLVCDPLPPALVDKLASALGGAAAVLDSPVKETTRAMRRRLAAPAREEARKIAHAAMGELLTGRTVYARDMYMAQSKEQRPANDDARRQREAVCAPAHAALDALAEFGVLVRNEHTCSCADVSVCALTSAGQCNRKYSYSARDMAMQAVVVAQRMLEPTSSLPDPLRNYAERARVRNLNNFIP